MPNHDKLSAPGFSSHSFTGSAENRRVLVAMSGGVDSSVAAYLLKERGYRPEGVTFKLWCHGNDDNYRQIIDRAAAVCSGLEIKHHVIDIEGEFKETVVRHFVEKYLSGLTPNPCVFCNRVIKWRYLLLAADRSGIPFVATGHYARIEQNADTGRYELMAAADKRKDQSYMLWQLSQDMLKRTLFPLGNQIKSDVKEIARQMGLHDENLKESQDVCFLPNNDYREFLNAYAPERVAQIARGELVDENNKVLGYHDGFHNFTIGQRKGFKMGFAGRKYVKEIDAVQNRVVIADNDRLFSRGMVIGNVNWVSSEPRKSVEGFIRIRYNHKGVKCRIESLDDKNYQVRFETGQRAVTPGQSAVLYRDNRLILGGTITKPIE
ncbi:MAG: tRNA 2-thiouridine(34) synthase MnmA [Candidatus Marinimicrobia bacterium]|nr:tRNA 2-thiouridine(34) synthase MnmA [Candidatus Neomarinimicrobiota bacterium]RKY61605.1 MAG: tRNA 2-thiouridine(34) synthase MnmA [Candidatus Neomarinimicrobiota bacterium]